MENRTIDGLRFEMTCGACPEQYDIYLDDVQVGYARLRHGRFTVEFMTSDQEIVYVAWPEGDGIFTTDERDFHLKMAAEALNDKLF